MMSNCLLPPSARFRFYDERSFWPHPKITSDATFPLQPQLILYSNYYVRDLEARCAGIVS